MEKVPTIKAVEGPFQDSLYYCAGALARAVEKLAIDCWKPTCLSPSLGHILHYKMNYASVTGPTVIAKNLLLSPSTMTRLLEKLEKKGLVHRFVYDRARMVQLTSEAWELEPLITECEFTFRKRCIALLGEEVGLTCKLLATTTDILNVRPTVGTPTENSPKNTDLYSENKTTWKLQLPAGK
jgi:MarR family transcriptional regulator, organic hydroperoxide resistance regulator